MTGVERREECAGCSGDGVEAGSWPSAFMSKPSRMRTVPPPRSACSKSISVRDPRRCTTPASAPSLPPPARLLSRDAVGCSVVGNADGGTGDRGDDPPVRIIGDARLGYVLQRAVPW